LLAVKANNRPLSDVKEMLCWQCLTSAFDPKQNQFLVLGLHDFVSACLMIAAVLAAME
jgi:hypothetical protein